MTYPRSRGVTKWMNGISDKMRAMVTGIDIPAITSSATAAANIAAKLNTPFAAKNTINTEVNHCPAGQ